MTEKEKRWEERFAWTARDIAGGIRAYRVSDLICRDCIHRTKVAGECLKYGDMPFDFFYTQDTNACKDYQKEMVKSELIPPGDEPKLGDNN